MNSPVKSEYTSEWFGIFIAKFYTKQIAPEYHKIYYGKSTETLEQQFRLN